MFGTVCVEKLQKRLYFCSRPTAAVIVSSLTKYIKSALTALIDFAAAESIFKAFREAISEAVIRSEIENRRARPVFLVCMFSVCVRSFLAALASQLQPSQLKRHFSNFERSLS